MHDNLATPAAQRPPAPGDPAADDPAAGDPAADDPARSNPTSSNPTSSNPTSSNPARSDPARSDPARSDLLTDGPALGELALAPPLRVAKGTTLREVAGVMEDSGISCVLVGTSQTWIVTEHDLAGALAAGMRADAPVEQVATRTPVWATTSSTLVDALGMMVSHGIRHLLVITAGGEPEGVLALGDATRMLLERA